MRQYDPDKHHRRSIRLKDYDYSTSRGYFVTICTFRRECILGEVLEDEVYLTPSGLSVTNTWNQLVNHYPYLVLHAFVVMPNHIHGVLFLHDFPVERAGLRPAPTETPKRHSLPEVIRALKSFSARRVNEMNDTPGTPLWQRNYYEHIIRDETSLEKICAYIHHNPASWANDEENPHRT